MSAYNHLQNFAKRHFTTITRVTLTLIYVWFGLLKLFGLSPAEALVQELFAKTISFLPFVTFYGIFAAFEIIIGLLFLFPRFTRLALSLFALHMIATILPLFMLPSLSWLHPLVPTLTGQYIIKNLALIACALGIAAHTPAANDNLKATQP